MVMKTNRIWWYLLLALTSSPLLAAPQAQLPLFYRLIQTLGAWATPVPLVYANATPERDAYAAMSRLLLDLTRPDDRVVLVGRDGIYSVFRITATYTAVPLLPATPSQPGDFAALATRYQRVWVILDDPRAGWHAQPPAALAPVLASQYMNLPLPLPTYFADASVTPGSTNFWLLRANLLQRIAALSPAQLTAHFILDLSLTYRRFGDPTNALLTLQKGVDAFPANPYLHRRLAECYFDDMKDYRQAIEHNRRAARNYRLLYATPMYDALFNTALAYQNLGQDLHAQLQYNDILAELDQYPDALWESRTRRYLGNLLLKMGNTNEALRHFQLDLRLRAQHPGYSYDRLLELLHDLRRHDAYARLAREYFDVCGSNDVRAIIRYLPILHHTADHAMRTNALLQARAWMSRNVALKDELRRHPSWTDWTNITLTLGLAPE